MDLIQIKILIFVLKKEQRVTVGIAQNLDGEQYVYSTWNGVIGG